MPLCSPTSCARSIDRASHPQFPILHVDHRCCTAGNYEEAINKYCKAAEYLLTALKYEKNPVTLKTIREKCQEYTSRAETLKKGLDKGGGKAAAGGGGGGGGGKDEDDDEDDGPEPEPLTEEELKQAENNMEEELQKLVGMDSVKNDMRRLCRQLMLDIKRRQNGLNTLDSIRHMMFTGNPGVGKTTVSRLVARLFKELGVSTKDTVVEVQKGDLVAGYVNQTGAKTAKKIKEARGGILFVDEAYQLTQALQRGQSDFSGEAIDEMMKVMNESGRKATTFVFAGYKKEMDEFLQYNAGLESRVKYKFHFEDYNVQELVKIATMRIDRKGYKLTRDASASIGTIIDKGTNAEMRSKYNGRLIDNLLQWANDEMNNRLPIDAPVEMLNTFEKVDLEKAMARFATARPPQKVDKTLGGGREIEQQLTEWQLGQYSELFVRAGYRRLYDLLWLKNERDIRALGITKEGDVRRADRLVERLRQQHREISLDMDAKYIDGDTFDIPEWLNKRSLGEFSKAFTKHKIDFDVLGDLTYEDIKEIGITEVGSRRKVFREISRWREEKELRKEDALRERMDRVVEMTPGLGAGEDDVEARLNSIKQRLPVA